MYKGTITIKLKSDLCTGSGYAYAGIIDSDICYDEVGIPYIPGKRLKGCFRETATSFLYSLYDEKMISNIFGSRGQADSSKLTVGNARILNYKNAKNIFENEIAKDSSVYNQQSILEEYTRVIAQTKLNDDGSADEGSLRYTRVINHFAPGNDENELIFEAPISADLNNEEKIALENIIKATRNIGLKRNRGLGSVICDLKLNESPDKDNNIDISGTDDLYIVSYEIENIDPLILSSESSDESESYILGQNLLGVLAGRYLSLKGTSAEDKLFKDLFLNGTVCYSNIYPSVCGRNFYPAPEYINVMKKSKALVNLLDIKGQELVEQNKDDNNEEVIIYSRRNGNQPKKLKDKFISIDNDLKISTAEVQKGIIYHHSHHIENSEGKEGLLYASEVISPGQHFSGNIIAPEKYVKLISSFLEQGDMFFGKSRTAQYGRCELIKASSNKLEIPYIHYKSGDQIVITFKSDGLFIDENGIYTIYNDKLPFIIAQLLGIENYSIAGSFIKTSKYTGYLGVWNLRKDAIPAVKAGSAIIMTLNSDIDLPIEKYIGERNLEGYGVVSIDNISSMKYKVNKKNVSNDDNVSDLSVTPDIKCVIDNIGNANWLNEKKIEFIDTGFSFSSSAGLGRITLMLKESLAKNIGYEAQYKDFANRIASIKSNKLKSDGEYLLKKFGKKRENNWEFTWLNDMSLDTSVKEKRKNYWGDCLMTALIVAKYEKGDAK